MSTGAHHDGEHPLASHASRAPSAVVIISIVSLVLLLMGFSLAATLLGQTAIAVMAGTAAVTLVGEIIRQFLVYGAGRSRDTPVPAVSSSHHEQAG